MMIIGVPNLNVGHLTDPMDASGPTAIGENESAAHLAGDWPRSMDVLYEPRRQLLRAWAEFERSSDRAFLLIGDSGTGKSAFASWLAQRLQGGCTNVKVRYAPYRTIRSRAPHVSESAGIHSFQWSSAHRSPITSLPSKIRSTSPRYNHSIR